MKNIIIEDMKCFIFMVIIVHTADKVKLPEEHLPSFVKIIFNVQDQN